MTAGPARRRSAPARRRPPGLGGLAEAVGEHADALDLESTRPPGSSDRRARGRIRSRRKGLHHYENLAILSAVVGKRFTFFGLPLGFRRGHGWPFRAGALLDA